MRVRMLVSIFLLVSCIIIVPAITVAFPTVHSNEGAGFGLNSGPFIPVVGLLHPDEPGSGGGCAGVI